MNRNDLRRVDMNLLVIFETLMFEKNLTRAGEKLFLGQPAVSASLAKLRDLFDDPLLVRNGRILEPTQRALQILKELQPAMDTISGAVSRAKDFDPSTSRDVFRIGLSDDAEFGLFPPLLKQMREEAQNVVVVVRRVNFLLMSSMLASGEISVGISYTTELPANAKRKKLRDLSVKILRGDNRPGALTLDEYLRTPPCAGVVFRGSDRCHRQRPGPYRPFAPGGAGGAAVRRPAGLAGGHRHARHGAGLRRVCADRRQQPVAGRRPAV